MAEKLKRLVTTILDSGSPAYSLRPELLEMVATFTGSREVGPESRQDISVGETRTLNGLAISPAMAAMCVEDYVRTIAFLRGTYDAITDVRNRFPRRPARVLYVGCGPYAALAVPLMTIFSSAEANFTLLDLHSESITSARSIIETLGLSGSVSSYETQDAGSYCVSSDDPPDIILIEIMQACLEAEPQVAVARHLLPQAPGAILVPEEVRVDLKLIDPGKEFALDAPDRNESEIDRDRLTVGSVFVLNRESVDSWKSITSGCLPGLSVQVPEATGQRYQPMLFTEICVYQNHILKDYDSGLTCPRVLSTDKAIRAGDTIKFYYELGPRPGLKSKVCT